MSRSTAMGSRGFAKSRSPPATAPPVSASCPPARSCPNTTPASSPSPQRRAKGLDERVADRLDRRAQLQALTARERRYLTLQAIGLSYSEIAAREDTVCSPTAGAGTTRARRRRAVDSSPSPRRDVLSRTPVVWLEVKLPVG
jgi:hypothetical protein